jgi:hypothetical protein
VPKTKNEDCDESDDQDGESRVHRHHGGDGLHEARITRKAGRLLAADPLRPSQPSRHRGCDCCDHDEVEKHLLLHTFSLRPAVATT